MRLEDDRRAGGQPVAPDRGEATDRTLNKALSRAYRWQKVVDDGVYECRNSPG